MDQNNKMNEEQTLEDTAVESTVETHRERQERHEKHQALMQMQRDSKLQRREDHYKQKHQRSVPPNTIV